MEREAAKRLKQSTVVRAAERGAASAHVSHLHKIASFSASSRTNSRSTLCVARTDSSSRHSGNMRRRFSSLPRSKYGILRTGDLAAGAESDAPRGGVSRGRANGSFVLLASAICVARSVCGVFTRTSYLSVLSFIGTNGRHAHAVHTDSAPHATACARVPTLACAFVSRLLCAFARFCRALRLRASRSFPARH